MYLPVEYVQTSSFTPIDKQSAIKALDDQIDKLEMTDDAAKSLLADLKVGLDMVSSGYISFGKSHQTLIVYADSPERLVKDTNIVTTTLGGFRADRNLFNLESWRSVFCSVTW